MKDIAKSTSHSQTAEMSRILGADQSGAAQLEREQELRAAAEQLAQDLKAEIDAAGAQVADLTSQLEAEKEAHAKTQAALDAATK